MGEVLSQNEIDSLLKALSSGELDVDEIKDDNEVYTLEIATLLNKMNLIKLYLTFLFKFI